MRNSNLFPVKAKGLVRLRSVRSCGSLGREAAPISILPPLLRYVGLAVGGRVEDVGELVAEENGDDGGRSLVPAEAQVVAGGRHRRAQLGRITVDRLDHGGDEEQEAGVGGGIRAGLEEVEARIGAQGPIDVLARAVDPGEGLLVHEGGHPVAPRHDIDGLHHELIGVGGDVGARSTRRRARTGSGRPRCAGSSRSRPSTRARRSARA